MGLFFQSKDQDFDDDGDDEDAEETIDEQEKHEKIDYSNELNDLKAEGKAVQLFNLLFFQLTKFPFILTLHQKLYFCLKLLC